MQKEKLFNLDCLSATSVSMQQVKLGIKLPSHSGAIVSQGICLCPCSLWLWPREADE